MQKEYPGVSGLTWHRHQYYSFFIPGHWHIFEWMDERKGVVYGPDPSDSLTIFAVDMKDLGIAITTSDLPDLAQGFFESIERLLHARIEAHEESTIDGMISLEAKFTFVDNGELRRRWVRVFYLGTRQIAFIAQGATPEKYDYWLPWFYEAMMTANVHTQKPKGNF